MDQVESETEVRGRFEVLRSGGFDLAVELTNACRVLWANDNDTAAVETYRQNFESLIVRGDVRRIDVPEVPCDILIGGPPCQDYSVLWLHEGVRTSRGALYMEFVRFLAELQPKAFILENVKGLLSANAGEAWALVRAALKAPTGRVRASASRGRRTNVAARARMWADEQRRHHRGDPVDVAAPAR